MDKALKFCSGQSDEEDHFNRLGRCGRVASIEKIDSAKSRVSNRILQVQKVGATH